MYSGLQQQEGFKKEQLYTTYKGSLNWDIKQFKAAYSIETLWKN